MSDIEMEIWEVLHRHVQSIFTHDVDIVLQRDITPRHAY